MMKKNQNKIERYWISEKTCGGLTEIFSCPRSRRIPGSGPPSSWQPHKRVQRTGRGRTRTDTCIRSALNKPIIFVTFNLKNHRLAWRAILWPLFFLYHFFHQLPRIGLGQVGLFELTLRPSSAHNLTSCLASGTSEIKEHYQVCPLEVPGHHQKQLTQALFLCKNTLSDANPW